jgi:hypothetical protein
MTERSPRLKAPRDFVSWFFWVVLLIVVPLVAIWMAQKPGFEKIAVLRHDIPAYRVIAATDVVSTNTVAATNLSNVIRDESRLINHYTRTLVKAGQPINENQIVAALDQQLKTIAVAIPVSRITMLTGSLEAGEIVNVSLASDPSQPPQVIVDAAFVLDVLSSEQKIFLAIPEDRWTDYLKNHNAPLLIAKRTK